MPHTPGPCAHDYVEAQNYGQERGNVECHKCGALWLAWTPVRDQAPAMLAMIQRLVATHDQGAGRLDVYFRVVEIGNARAILRAVEDKS